MRDCISPLVAKSRTKTRGKLTSDVYNMRDCTDIGSIHPGMSNVDV